VIITQVDLPDLYSGGYTGGKGGKILWERYQNNERHMHARAIDVHIKH